MATESALGTDTSATSQIHFGRTVTGAVLVGEAIYRRLITARGQLLSDPSYGWAIATRLGAPMTSVQLKALAGQIRNEVSKDDRVEPATIFVSVNQVSADNEPLAIEVEVSAVTVEGESFALTMSASAATVQLLGIVVR